MSVTGLLHTPFTWPLFVFVILTLQKPELGNSNSLSIVCLYPGASAWLKKIQAWWLLSEVMVTKLKRAFSTDSDFYILCFYILPSTLSPMPRLLFHTSVFIFLQISKNPSPLFTLDWSLRFHISFYHVCQPDFYNLMLCLTSC